MDSSSRRKNIGNRNLFREYSFCDTDAQSFCRNSWKVMCQDYSLGYVAALKDTLLFSNYILARYYNLTWLIIITKCNSRYPLQPSSNMRANRRAKVEARYEGGAPHIIMPKSYSQTLSYVRPRYFIV